MAEEPPQPKRVTSKNGAVREAGVAGSKDSKHPARYDLISTIGYQRLAETYGEGSVKYSDNSYLKGFPADDLMNHVLAHLNKWRARVSAKGAPLDMRNDKEPVEDDLAHAAWGLFTLMHFEETRPDLINIGAAIPENQHI